VSTRADRRRRKEKIAAALKMAQTPEQKRISAYHEASHGVLSELYSLPVEYISVVPEVAPKNHPEALRARSLGAIAVRAGGCQLKTENGVFSLKTPESVVFNGVSLLASIRAEEKLGVSLEQMKQSCNGDRTLLLSYFANHLRPEMKVEPKIAQTNALLFNMAAICNEAVDNPEIWTAIERVAALLIERGRIEGEEVRRIVRETVSEKLFFSPERQKAVLPAEFLEMFSMESFQGGQRD